MSEASGEMQEQDRSAEAACEIFKNLPSRIRRDVIWRLYEELVNIYIGKSPFAYHEVPRLRGFTEMFDKLPEDSEYRRHFFVLASDKDPEELTPEEKKFCEYELQKLRRTQRGLPVIDRSIFPVVEEARSTEAAGQIFKTLPEHIQFLMAQKLYKELKDIYIGERPDEDSWPRRFTEMFAKLPEHSKYRRHFFVLGSDKDREELTPEEKEIFGKTVWLLQRVRNCFRCGAGRREMQEQPASAEAAGEIFKYLPDRIQHDLISELDEELKDIYIGKSPFTYDEVSRPRGFTEMFAKLPEDSKYRRHFFVLGSDKDLEELTPEEKEIFWEAFGLLQRLRNSFGCGAGRREMQEQPGSAEAAGEIFKYFPDRIQYDMISKLYEELTDIYIGKSPVDEDFWPSRFTEMFEKLPEDSEYRRHFFVLGSDKDPEELTPEEKKFCEYELQKLRRTQQGLPVIDRSIFPVVEEARSTEAAGEIFKTLPIDIQDDMIWKLFEELKDIYIGERPDEDDEDSWPRRFTEMFAKLPEDSKYRRHFFVLGSDKDREELTPKEKEIFGKTFWLLQRVRNSFRCGAGGRELQEQPGSAEAAGEIFKYLPDSIQHDMISKLYKELNDIYTGKSPFAYDEVSRPRGFTEMFAKLPEDSKYRRHFFVLGSDKDLEELTPEEKDIFGKAFWLLQRIRISFGCGAGRREMQEQPRSAEAAGEIFKYLPDHVQYPMISKLYKELIRDIYIDKPPYESDEVSRLRSFTGLFRKLPEDSKFRRHFFVLVSNRCPEELTPEEKEILEIAEMALPPPVLVGGWSVHESDGERPPRNEFNKVKTFTLKGSSAGGQTSGGVSGQ